MMPRPRFPHLHHERTRHGKLVFYVRRGKGPRIRIAEQPGTPAFEEAYLAALAGERPRPKQEAASGTLEWLIAGYQASSAWALLSPATQSQRANIFKRMVAKAGSGRLAALKQESIVAAMEAHAPRWHAANDFLKAARGLFRWAHKKGNYILDSRNGLG